MSNRLSAALFALIFLVGSVPILLVQTSGTASAGLSAGFMLPIQNFSELSVLLAIGFLSVAMGKEAIVLLPLCTLLMLAIGTMLQVDEHSFGAIRSFVIGAIILFTLSASMLDNKAHLLAIPPTAMWAYYTGGNFMGHIPTITTPIYFLLGTLISALLIIATGISVGITLWESVRESLQK